MLCLTWLPGQGEKQPENSFLAPSPGEHCCTFPRYIFSFGSAGVQKLWVHFLTTESREQNFCAVPHMAASAGYRTAREFFPGTFFMGGVLYFPKVIFWAFNHCNSEGSIFSPQKAGSSTFLLCLTWLPRQGEKQQENSFLASSPGEQRCALR